MRNYLLLIAVVVLSGCMKETSGNGNTGSSSVNGPVFDFSTVSKYTLNFKYDVPEDYIVGFEVYTEDPIQTDASGQYVIKPGLTPIEKGFTDKYGSYSNFITLPSYVSKVYVFTSFAGVNPRLLVANVVNGQLETATPVKLQNTGRSAQFGRSGGIVEYNTNQTNLLAFSGISQQMLTLSKWHTPKDGPNPTTLATGEQVKLYGRPVDMSYVDKTRFGANAAGKDALQISSNVLKTINTALKGDGNGPVDPIYLKSGDINVKTEAELDLIFIQNWGAYRNTLAYYCYETNNPPASPSEIKYQVVALPNAMEQKLELNISSMYDIVSMYKGEGVKLKYVDKNGNMSDKFPAGTSVGWVLYRNGYAMIGAPTVGQGANYSNPAFSVSPNTAILRYNDFVVVGFDDGDHNSTSRDYLDVVFNVQSNPSDAITDEIPDVDPSDPKPVTVTGMGIMMYEDLWPYQGDFDMNDVVVKYVSKTTKNTKNEVTNAEIDFTVLHSGASLSNSFAYYDPNISNATVQITEGAGATLPAYIDKTNNIVRLANKLLSYANKPEKVTFNVKYTYNTPIPTASYIQAPFNPFITIGTVSGEDDLGKEVHFTNYPPTAAADMNWFSMKTADWSNPSLGLYYITFENYSPKPGEDKGQQLPFAVNIAFDNEATMNGFIITEEKKNINTSYPKFKNWVRSNGKEDSDWYLHYSE